VTLSGYIVDAFADRPFAGNPAAVAPLEAWLPDALMQQMAMEHNLAETAFFLREGESYRIRWFSPVSEVDLCGHATLAAAFVIAQFVEPGAAQVNFLSRSGPLGVSVRDGTYTLDFPSRPAQQVDVDPQVALGLGGSPQVVLAARDYLAVYRTAAEVRALRPDMSLLAKLDRFAVIATAPGDEAGVDFVSRFFAPAQGVPEDPVTGSAHSTLIPYWAERLGKTEMVARQLSPRGGELYCRARGERVDIGGRAVLYAKTQIYIPS
jgi:PhzF family phenazine biosynthesis protein